MKVINLGLSLVEEILTLLFGLCGFGCLLLFVGLPRAGDAITSPSHPLVLDQGVVALPTAIVLT